MRISKQDCGLGSSAIWCQHGISCRLGAQWETSWNLVSLDARPSADGTAWLHQPSTEGQNVKSGKTPAQGMVQRPAALGETARVCA